ncbi:MAG: ketopantoate reductase family protein [Gaiella sp.]
MRPRVCVIGAGSIGSLLAGHLAAVADVSVLVRRPEHAEALNREGLTVSGRSDRHATVTAAADPALLAPFEIGIFATKAGGLDAAAASLSGRFPQATMVTVLNGLGADEIVRSHGAWPIVSGLTFMSGTKHSDTHVEYVLDTETSLGPFESTPFSTAQHVAELIASSGLKAQALEDLAPMRWSKLIFNATVNAVAALTGLPHDPHFADESTPAGLGHLVHALVDEGKAVAAAAGVTLHDDPWQMNVYATRRGSAHYPSMLEDVEAHRKTEIDLITGSLVREAEKHGVPVPLHSTLYRLVKAKEDSWSVPQSP